MAAVDSVRSMAFADAYKVESTPAVNVQNVQPVVQASAEKVQTENSSYKEGEKDTGEQQQREASEGQIKKAVSEINKKLDNTSCQFGIHEGTNRVMIKIVDKETKKVIKEFPPEETLDLIAKAWELAGIMVDKRL